MDQIDSEHAQQSTAKKLPQNSRRTPFFLDSANSFFLRLASTQRNPRRPPLASVVVVVDSVVVVVASVVVAASANFNAAPWT